MSTITGRDVTRPFLKLASVFHVGASINDVMRDDTKCACVVHFSRRKLGNLVLDQHKVYPQATDHDAW